MVERNPRNRRTVTLCPRPFCDTLCWFCGCHTKITQQHKPVADYLGFLDREIAGVADALGNRPKVVQVHWGGGSPTMLRPSEITTLTAAIKQHFLCDDALEFAVEIDPRGLDEARLDALAESGLTRASIGVQDFNPRVQQAINRVQSFELTAGVIQGLRARGVASINCDIMYGLPHQTVAGIEETVERVLELAPERIALFGYAHVPWMKRHQSMIDETILPTTTERYLQSQHAAELLVDAGYDAIGIDHFARSDDSLARAARTGTMKRNFQGYTVDRANTILGLGPSAIGKLPQGYVQNTSDMATYKRETEAHGLAAIKGVSISAEDRLRGYVIERLMCDFAFTDEGLRQHFGAQAETIIDEARRYAAQDADDVVRYHSGRFEITSRGRPYARTICSWFDSYFGAAPARHSVAV